MRKRIRGNLVLFVAAVAALVFFSFSAIFAAEQDPQNESARDTTRPAATTGKPKIFFPETSYDFGAVPKGSVNTHVFKVKNTGDAPLTLIKAQAG